MNILRSFTETVVTTPTDLFPISFEYDEKYDAVHVFLNDVAVEDLGYTVSQVNAVTLKVEPAIPEGTVRIERETDIDKMTYIFDAGALFIDQNVDADFKQIIHSQQEVRDGFIKLRGDVLPLVHGLQEALKQAQEASEAAQEAAEAAEEAAQHSRSASNVFDDNGSNQQQINDILRSDSGAGYIGFKLNKISSYIKDSIGWGITTATGKDVHLLRYLPITEITKVLDGTTTYDASAELAAAITEATLTGARLVLPSGKINYSTFPNIKQSGFCMVGSGSNKTTLNYTGTGSAVLLNAFDTNLPTDPFIQGVNIGGFRITGSNFVNGLYIQGVARSQFFDIMVNGSSGLDGTVGFRIAGCMLNTFSNLKTSYVFGNLPYRGIYISNGSRAGSSVGGSSNNVWIAPYTEGNYIGIQLATDGADQNTFIGGSPEACKSMGLFVGQRCRYNTFIGMGFENKDATNGDVNDAGMYNVYNACYSSNKFIIGGASTGIKVTNGFFERIEIQTNAKAAIVDQVTIKHWNTSQGGLFDNGFDSKCTRVRDSLTNTYVHVYRPRASVTVGTSPYEYVNPYEIPIKVRVQGGTVTQCLIKRGADSWTEPNPTPAGGGTGNVGIYLLCAGDSLVVSFSTAPLISQLPFIT